MEYQWNTGGVRSLAFPPLNFLHLLLKKYWNNLKWELLNIRNEYNSICNDHFFKKCFFLSLSHLQTLCSFQRCATHGLWPAGPRVMGGRADRRNFPSLHVRPWKHSDGLPTYNTSWILSNPSCVKNSFTNAWASKINWGTHSSKRIFYPSPLCIVFSGKCIIESPPKHITDS